MMKNFHRMVGILVLMHDQSSGAGAGRPQRPPADQLHASTPRSSSSSARGSKHCAEILFASGATAGASCRTAGRCCLDAEQPRDVLRQRGARQGEIPIASTHPQSTCQMGEDRRRAVVNSYCQSHDLPNLFVCDMSVFPTSLGAPPQISTAALADRTAQYIKAQWSTLTRGR